MRGGGLFAGIGRRREHQAQAAKKTAVSQAISLNLRFAIGKSLFFTHRSSSQRRSPGRVAGAAPTASGSPRGQRLAGALTADPSPAGGEGRRGGPLLEDLPERGRGAVWLSLAAEARQAVHFQRLGDLGQGLDARRGDGNQQQLAAARSRCPAGVRPGCAAEDLEDLAGQEGRAARGGPPHGPGDQQEQPQHHRQAAGHGDRGRQSTGRACGHGMRVCSAAAAAAGGQRQRGCGGSRVWPGQRPSPRDSPASGSLRDLPRSRSAGAV